MKHQPRNISAESSCMGKVPFESFALAMSVNKARGGRRHLARQPYHCRHCHKYHLGSKKGK